METYLIASMKAFSSQSSKTMRDILVDEHNFVAAVMFDSLLTLNPNASNFFKIIAGKFSSLFKDT